MKCAIVGNSPIVLEKEWGNEIDSHDIVVRFNIAKTQGFEKHVGSKSSIRFSNLHPVLCRTSKVHLEEHASHFPEWDNDAILNWKNEDIYFKGVAGTLESSELFEILLKNNNRIHHIDPVAVERIKRMIGFEPTMGILSVIAMTSQQFDEVNCYGFNFYEDVENSHYFEKVMKYDQHEQCHNHEVEKKLIMSFHEAGKIRINR